MDSSVLKVSQVTALATDVLSLYLLLLHKGQKYGETRKLMTNTLKENFVYILRYDVLDFI